MKKTEQTLLEQMRISEFDIEHRKELLAFGEEDVAALLACRALVEAHIDNLVDEFYKVQTNIAEIALLIGDADTLERLRNVQRRYILDLFGGVYDIEYVNNRLRIGMVHKRIGVEPKLYLSAIQMLRELLVGVIEDSGDDAKLIRKRLKALEKLFYFDITLVFETYIRSLVSEIETAKNKSDQYARSLEEKVSLRTRQLEEWMRTDPLTGVLNRRFFEETVTRAMRAAERRDEPLTVVYLDIDDFKLINDREGHKHGDEVLRAVGEALGAACRSEDSCFRYGGDEFCIVLPNCTASEARSGFCRRLNETTDPRLAGIRFSVGIAQSGPGEYHDPQELVSRADADMYRDKQKAHGHLAEHSLSVVPDTPLPKDKPEAA